MNQMYMVLQEGGMAFSPSRNMFLFAETNKEAIDAVKAWLSDETNAEYEKVQVKEGENSDQHYLTTVTGVRITNKYDDIIQGVEITDFYHIYFLGIPQSGKLYPDSLWTEGGE